MGNDFKTIRLGHNSIEPAMMERSKRVLLVDDDEDILVSMETALVDHGYDVLTARDGTEALARVERDAPDLVVLDIIMPKRSGFSVLDRIRLRAQRGPRVIMVTAQEEERHRNFAEARGADAFLHKPFDMNRMLATVDALLGF